ncbi:AFG1/ZapE family ATPase, partial [Klebsiella variicola]
ERHVKVVVCAAVPLYDIYLGERLNFEFQRCRSRLQEMQSDEYLKRPHMPCEGAFSRSIESRKTTPGPA